MKKQLIIIGIIIVLLIAIFYIFSIKITLKDIFLVTTTIIAILTYAEVKKTYFQPIVIKKQLALLTELLDFVSKKFGKIKEVDYYYGIVQLNVYSLLREYNLHLKNQKEIDEYFSQSKSILTIENNIKGAERVKMFPDGKESIRKKDRYEEKMKNIKKGKIEINLQITKEHYEFIGKLEEYSNNPFLPQNIQQVLKDIIRENQTNLKIHLKDVLTVFMKQFYKEYLKGKELPINIPGIYNEFQNNRISHLTSLNNLKKEIRAYLMI